MFLIDVVLYKIACLIWPDEQCKKEKCCSSGSKEDGLTWIILDDLERDGKLQDNDSNDDPFLNGDYEDGPDW